MIELFTSEAVAERDRATIEGLGVSGAALMEIAARAVTELLVRRFGDRMVRKGSEAGRGQGPVVVVAGPGNNGGDGFVVARMLTMAGWQTSLVVPMEPRGGEARENWIAAGALGVPVSATLPAGLTGGVIVDALFGSGLQRDLEGEFRELVEGVNALDLPILAVDMPSGLCGSTGMVRGAAVRADATAMIGGAKVGALLEASGELCGELWLLEIGLVEGEEPAAVMVDGPWVADQLPKRSPGGHKGSSGRLGVIAGDLERAGAAVLVANAAISAGAGVVTLHIERDALPRLGDLMSEVMLCFDPYDPQLHSYDALAVGPGRGLGETAQSELERVWREAPVPAVFDADGLSAIALDGAATAAPRGITPHPGEAGRLLGTDSASVQADRLNAARELSRIAPALLKGRGTIVAVDGAAWINDTGGPSLATAGSGDVLTGVVGGLLAQGLTPSRALVVGAFIHGLAGELVGRQRLVASELIATLSRAMEEAGWRESRIRRLPLFGG